MTATRSKSSLAKLGAKNPNFGRHFSDEHKLKLRLSNVGKKHAISEQGRINILSANLRKRGRKWPHKLRFEAECPVCSKSITVYLTKSGKPSQKYHRSCWLIQLARNSPMASEVNKSVENRARSSVRIREYFRNNPLVVEHLRGTTLRYFENPENRERNRQAQILTHNTSEYKSRASLRMKEAIDKDPSQAPNSRLRRSRMTSIEKAVESATILPLLWNKPVRTNHGTKFPDFCIGYLAVQCDGDYWHKGREEDDSNWDIALLEKKYSVLRFTQKEIETQLDKVVEMLEFAYQKVRDKRVIYRSYSIFPELSTEKVTIW